MGTKKILLALILLCSVVSAYDVNRTYYLNESGGVIVDETVTSLNSNSLMRSVVPELILVLLILLVIFIPIFLLLLGMLFLLKHFFGDKHG
jgi:hypothetical protein